MGNPPRLRIGLMDWDYPIDWIQVHSAHLGFVATFLAWFIKDSLEDFRKKCWQWIVSKFKRRQKMNIPVFSYLIALVEELFKAHAPEIVAAASPEVKAAVTAAEGAAVAQVAQDPKVQAGIAAYQAIQNFKAAINTPPAQPPSA